MEKFYEGNLLEVVYKTTKKLREVYALSFVCKNNNNGLLAVRGKKIGGMRSGLYQLIEMGTQLYMVVI